ncbi:MAG: hypothetical protein JKY48_01115 [Flavobacteriales bacterium]|nr:hypothetical protein [Flavobacteriales bacterium]
MKHFAICFALLFLTLVGYSQDYYIKPTTSIANQFSNIQIEAMENGNYAVAGYSLNFFPSTIKNKIFIRKYNKCGDEIWSKEITNDFNSISLIKLHIDSNRNILLTANIDTLINTNRTFFPVLVKLDGNGNLIYSKKILSTPTIGASVSSSSIAANGDYLIYFIHNHTSTNFNEYKVSILRTKNDGSVIWAQHYNSDSKTLRNMSATNDNGAIFLVSNRLCKINNLGNIEWCNSYFTSQNQITDPIETDSGFVLLRFNSLISQVFLIRKDGSRNQAWNTNGFLNSDNNFFHNSKKGILRRNGNIVFSGSINSSTKAAFVEINPIDGSFVYLKTFNSTGILSGLSAIDITEDQNENILFSGEDNGVLFNNTIIGKLTDSLTSINCNTNSFPPPTQLTNLSSPSSVLLTTTLNTNYFSEDIAINLIPVSNTIISSYCEFTKDRGSYKLDNDTILCQKEIITLGNASSNFDSYLWSTGAVSKNIQVGNPGNYWLQVVSACDTLMDTVMISYYPEIGLELGEDTTICFGDSIILAKDLKFNNYNWSDGSSDST